MKFHTTETPGLLFGAIFTSGQNNTKQTNQTELVVPQDLIFRRIYVGFVNFNCGEPIVRLEMVFKNRGNTVGNSLRWEWGAGISPSAQVAVAGTSKALISPCFKVERVQYPTGNDHPYMDSMAPNSKMLSIPLQDNVTSMWYQYNVVMAPIQIVEEFSVAQLNLEVTSGAMPATATGQCWAFASIDSCKYPI